LPGLVDVCCLQFFRLPLNFGAVMTRGHAAIEQAKAYAPEPLWLVDEVSPWGSDIYLATDRPVPNMQTEYLSGTFMTKVFTGPYRNIGTWIIQTKPTSGNTGKKWKSSTFSTPPAPNTPSTLARTKWWPLRR
jgi:hypothetical protein